MSVADFVDDVLDAVGTVQAPEPESATVAWSATCMLPPLAKVQPKLPPYESLIGGLDVDEASAGASLPKSAVLNDDSDPDSVVKVPFGQPAVVTPPPGTGWSSASNSVRLCTPSRYQ